MRRFSLKLPVIPEPAHGTRSIFVQPVSDRPHPFFRGSGPAGLLCGQCTFKLAQGLGAGQIQNLVLKCPKCESYNDIPFIPALESLVSELLVAPDPIAKAVALKAKIEVARDSGANPRAVVEAVQGDSDALAKLLLLLEPKSAGDFYSMLACIVAFLAFLVALKQLSSPAVIVNQYFTSQGGPSAASRNATCPCGSGKKFKLCHGRRK